jgi:hypothetical protein
MSPRQEANVITEDEGVFSLDAVPHETIRKMAI